MNCPPRKHFKHGKGARFKNIEDRFWEKVKKTDGCWFWVAYRNRNGYGQFQFGTDKTRLASRYSWELANGKIQDGLCVLHKCDTPSCVRPDHLFLGTRDENIKDAKSKGRMKRGEKHGMAKLAEKHVKEMRKLDSEGKTRAWIAAKFGVSRSCVGLIVTKKRWTHI